MKQNDLEQAAVAAMQALLSNPEHTDLQPVEIADLALDHAIALNMKIIERQKDISNSWTKAYDRVPMLDVPDHSRPAISIIEHNSEF